MLEVRSEKTIEPTLRRIGKAVPAIFREYPMEIFVPVGKRDLDVFDLEAATYLFVRSSNFPGLLRLKTITGVVSLVTEGDSNRPSKVIPIDDFEVQRLIKAAEGKFREHSKGIVEGSFVRVLSGETRDFCGTVTALGGNRAVVKIALKTKSIMLETPISNLLNLSHIPLDLRTYYYCQLMADLKSDEEKEGTAALPKVREALNLEECRLLSEAEASEVDDVTADIVLKRIQVAKRAEEITEALVLIRRDVRAGEEPPPGAAEPEDDDAPEPRTFRQRTVTALVKKLILIDGVRTPMELAAKVIAAIKSGEAKTPKNFFIIYTIIKDGLMDHWVKKDNPAIGSYREAVKCYGESFKFAAKQIADIDPTLRIPLGSK